MHLETSLARGANLERPRNEKGGLTSNILDVLSRPLQHFDTIKIVD